MKIKRRAGLLMGVFFMLIGDLTVFWGLDSADHAEMAVNATAETDKENVYIHAAGHEIALWRQNGQSYAFLPSACKGMNFESQIADTTDPDSVVWMYSENIPAVFINTESGTTGQIHADKNVKEAGKISVLDTDGVTRFRMPLSYIKSRGNTSFTSYEKKRI